MTTTTTLALLALAGAAGSLLRYVAGVLLPARRTLPWGILIVNVLGSGTAGVVVAGLADPVTQLVLLTGFCGGLTTLSTHAVDTVLLIRRGFDEADARREPLTGAGLALAHVAVTLGLSVGAAMAGMALAEALPGT
jgi:fluoride exporter